MDYNDLSEIPGHLLARAVVQVRTVELRICKLSSAQSTDIFDWIVGEASQLKQLTMSLNDLSEVPGHLLARAVGKVTTVELTDNQLSSDQITDVFNSIVEEEDLALEELDIDIPDDIPLSLVNRVKERLRLKDLNY